MHHRMRRFGTSLSVAAVMLSSTLVAVTSGATAAGASSLASWDPTTLPLLSVQSGTGVSVPVLRNDVVDGSLGIATSLQPVLTWKQVPSGVSQAKFTVTNLASNDPTTVWSTTVSVNGGTASATVAAGKLVQGHTYRWQAVSVSNPSVATPKFTMNVDTQRSGAQSLWTSGPLSVAEVSGEPVTIYSSNSVTTKEGSAAFSLVYRPTNARQADLPPGWQLEPGSNTSNWVGLKVNSDSSVNLISQTGETVTFIKADASGDSYTPDFGADQTWPNGSVTTLVPETLPDGSTQWTATEQNRMVTVFTPTTATKTLAEPAQIWSQGSLLLQQQWSDGRLQALIDPTSSGHAFDFYYAGSPNCPSITGITGAITPPSGMLCAATDWAGENYGVYYIQTPAGPRIGRIVTGVGAMENAQVTDYQWDASGRLVALRPPSITSDVASGAVAGLGNQDARALYQMTYDAEGRVSSITPPAGLVPGSSETSAQQSRVATNFSYTPNFQATVQGTPVGATSSSIATMLPSWSSTGSGGKSTMTWNTATGNLLEEKNAAGGSVTKTIYDSSGQPIEQIGPTTAALTSSLAPKTMTAYDQDANGNPWIGLATTYYGNADFDGAPRSGSIGPVFDSTGRAPASLNFDFPSPPPGVTPDASGWSARLTGSYLATTKGSYTFTNQHTQTKVWINGAPCLPSCTITLDVNAQASIRIDVTSGPAAPAVQIVVTTPNGGSGPVPTSSLRPSLGYATSETTFDSLSATSPSAIGVAQKLQVKMTVDPTTGRVLTEQTPAGTTTSTTYNADGSPATSTNAAGETTSISYYAGTQNTSIACDNTTAIPQRGLVQSISRPGIATTTSLHGTSGATSQSTQGSTVACGSSHNPFVGLAAVSGTGEATGSMGSSLYLNNPMKSYQAVGTSETSRVEVITSDLLGRIFQDVDEWGTTTTYSYDPVSDQLTSLKETTSTGASRTETFAYNAQGQITETAVDGRNLENVTFDPTTGLTSSATLANGVKVTYGYGANLQLTSLAYGFPDGKSTSDKATYSAGGRLLCHETTAPDGTATQCYGADLNGKITKATETGSLEVLANSWTASYSGAQGANADRASLTASLTSKGQSVHKTTNASLATNATYGAGDVMTSLSSGGSPVTLQSDATGRTTQRGATSLSYDAAGDLLSAAKDGASVTYSYGPSGMDEEMYSPAPAAPSSAEGTTNSSSSSSTTSSTTTTAAAAAGVTGATGADSRTNSSSTSSTTSSTTTSSSTTTTSETTTTKHQSHTAATGPISVRYSGVDLLLNDKNEIVGQVLSLASGVTVGLNNEGQPTQYAYPEIDGSVAWRSTGAAPGPTNSYDPWGEWNSAAAAPTPTDAVSLVLDQEGWGAGQGGMTIAVAPAMVELGSRTYDAQSGRFLQPDSELSSANLYAYADGDPVDGTDPTGNFGSFGDIFSMLVGVVVGVVAAVAVPVTGGLSASLLAVAATMMTTAAVDFAASAIGQGIDNGWSNIDWAQAGINSAISTGISVATFGLSRLTAAPTLLRLHKAAAAGFSGNTAKAKLILTGLKSQGFENVGSELTWAGFKQQVDEPTKMGFLGKRLWWGTFSKAPKSSGLSDDTFEALMGNLPLPTQASSSVRLTKPYAESVVNPGAVGLESLRDSLLAPVSPQRSMSPLDSGLFQKAAHDSMSSSHSSAGYRNSYLQQEIALYKKMGRFS